MKATHHSSGQRRALCGLIYCTLLVVLTIFGCSQTAVAQQWNTNGNDISNANSGNVGIGTTAPGTKLTVIAPTGVRSGLTVAGEGNAWIYTDLNLSPIATGIGTGKPINFAWSVRKDAFYGGDSSGPSLVMEVFRQGGGVYVPFIVNPNGNLILAGATNATNGNVGIGTTAPSSRLHVDGGSIRLAQTAGQTPFQLYSYENSDSLWLTSGNSAKSEIHLSPSHAVDYDRSIALKYVPGSTGAAGGILNVGQLMKNAATFTHGATAFYTNGAERVRINSAGNVGIGSSAPGHRLDVQGGAVNASGGLCIAGDCKTAWSQVGGSQWTTSGSTIHYNTGNVGIGTTNPGSKLFVGSGTPAVQTLAGLNVALGSASYVSASNGTENIFMGADGSGYGILGTLSNHSVGFRTANIERVRIDTSGNVGIGTASPTAKLHVAGDSKVTGNLTVDGNIAAKYQDVAEWVPAVKALPAGTVVTLNRSQSNLVEASSKAYDTRVAGVVSERPGLALGERGDNKLLIATTGRVKIKVDATHAPIEIGDLLVTSEEEGIAMKSVPVNFGGVEMHRPGTLIGKALEPLAKGQGEILVLLSLQ